MFGPWFLVKATQKQIVPENFGSTQGAKLDFKACLYDPCQGISFCQDISSCQDTPPTCTNQYNYHFVFTWEFHVFSVCRDDFILSWPGEVSRLAGWFFHANRNRPEIPLCRDEIGVSAHDIMISLMFSFSCGYVIKKLNKRDLFHPVSPLKLIETQK